MSNQPAQNYLRTKVFTATPEQLQLMLYDGAIRFAEQAKLALEQKKYDQSYDLLSRTQKIIAEMTGSLKHDICAGAVRQAAALYNFVYRKLIEANVEHTDRSRSTKRWTSSATSARPGRCCWTSSARPRPPPPRRSSTCPRRTRGWKPAFRCRDESAPREEPFHVCSRQSGFK